MKTRFLFPLVATLLAASAAWPADTAQEIVERQRIAVERRQADDVLLRRQQACRARFAVAACMEEARKEHRDAMQRLRLQESVLEEAQRKLRAAERMQSIRDKVSAEESSPRVPAAREDRANGRRQSLAASAPASAADARPKPARAAAAAPQKRSAGSIQADRTATEVKRRAEYQARLDAAQAHRDAVERRNAQRAASGKKAAAPLPPASAASKP
jgi:colicin import membrane protein